MLSEAGPSPAQCAISHLIPVPWASREQWEGQGIAFCKGRPAQLQGAKVPRYPAPPISVEHLLCSRHCTGCQESKWRGQQCVDCGSFSGVGEALSSPQKVRVTFLEGVMSELKTMSE